MMKYLLIIFLLILSACSHNKFKEVNDEKQKLKDMTAEFDLVKANLDMLK